MLSRMQRINLQKCLTKFRQTVGIVQQHVNSISTVNMKEEYVNVDGININCLITGKGDHPVLLLPGALGSIWTDFKPQIEYLDKELFTIVAWDPPGYGKSRPPDRTFPSNYFRRDAYWACSLMKKLGFSKFSLVGWSGGGITSIILAAKHPECVRKLICFGSNAYLEEEDIKMCKPLRNIDNWEEKVRAPLVAFYGEEYLRKTWSGFVNAMDDFVKNHNGVIISNDELKKVHCPTLIIHGEKDRMVLSKHPKYLKEHISGARLEFFKNGSHNLHLTCAKDFNVLMQDFLLK